MSTESTYSEDITAEFALGEMLEGMARYEEAVAHYERAHQLAERSGEAVAVGEADFRIGQALLRRHEPSKALDRFRAAKRIFQQDGDPAAVARCDRVIGAALDDLGRPGEALERHLAARGVLERIGTPHDLAVCDLEIALVLGDMGRPADAVPYFLSALERYEQVGSQEDKALCRQNFGIGLNEIGYHEAAIAQQRAAREIWSHLGNLVGVVDCDMNIATAVAASERREEALAIFRGCVDAYRALRSDVQAADATDSCGWQHAFLGRYEEALEHHASAYEVYADGGHDSRRAIAACGLGHALDHLGRPDEAVERLREALEIEERVGARLEAGRTRVSLSIVLLGTGDVAEARALLTEAHGTFTDFDATRDLAWAEQGLGDASVLEGDLDQAKKRYARARDIFRDEGQWDLLARCPVEPRPGDGPSLAHDHPLGGPDWLREPGEMVPVPKARFAVRELLFDPDGGEYIGARMRACPTNVTRFNVRSFVEKTYGEPVDDVFTSTEQVERAWIGWAYGVPGGLELHAVAVVVEPDGDWWSYYLRQAVAEKALQAEKGETARIYSLDIEEWFPEAGDTT